MGGRGGGDEETSGKKVKFLCSHGGRILLRPSDGQLKYVGGETRLVAVPRHITFSELKRRLSEMVEGETVLKYQIMGEELDLLVTVRTEEDLQHMIQHHDLAPKLRTFLFPTRRFPRVHSSPTLYRRMPSPTPASTFANNDHHSYRIIHRAESLPLPGTLWD